MFSTLFHGRHTLAALLVAAVISVAPLGAQPLNGPAVDEGVGIRASLVGTPVPVGTQTVAPTGQCSKVSISLTVTLIGTVDDGGGRDEVQMEIWDDGVRMAQASASVPVDGDPHTVTLTAEFEGMYATGVPGVGVQLRDGGTLLFSEDPFIPTDVQGSCEGAAPPPYMPVPGPTGTVILLLGAVLALLGMRRLRRQAG